MTQAQEDHLVARCKAGDMEALGLVYARFERPVYRYAYHFLGHEEDANDVKQETFVRAFQRIESFRGSASLKTWLFTICANLCRDRLKRSSHRYEVLTDMQNEQELPYPTDTESDPAKIVVAAEQARLLKQALHALPSQHREILLLRDIEGIDVPEVARILGCTRMAVNVRLFRARQRLKERVAALLA